MLQRLYLHQQMVKQCKNLGYDISKKEVFNISNYKVKQHPAGKFKGKKISQISFYDCWNIH